MLRNRTALLVLAVLLLGVAAPLTAQTRKLTLDSYFDLENVSNPQISPDGKQIVYVRGWIDKLNDQQKSAIWIMNADGSRNRFLVEGSSPLWSPDGTRIAYLAEGQPKGSQLWVRWMDAEGAQMQITRVDRAPGGIAWAPDSQSIGFTMLVPKKDSWNIKMPARPDGAKWTENPRIIERMNYRRDRIGFIEEGTRHVFVVTASGGTQRQLSSGDFEHGTAISWTPDGREILFSGLRSDDWE